MNSEQQRFDLIRNRDGVEHAIRWIEQTLSIYRAAVLNKQHYASKGMYRRKFITAYCNLKTLHHRR